MREQVDRLTKLATDLLDLSRLDAGRMRVEHEPVDLGEVGGTVAAEFGALAERSGHAVEVVVQGRPVARADELRVLQVARALVDNALTHTPPGTHITVRARADREHAYLEVEDDGPGIPPEHAPHVFDRFYRGDGTVASGSGLGLAIARELAQMMDGTVVLESQPGRTLIRVVLGAAPTSIPAPEAEAEPFSRENGTGLATVSAMRAGALAAVSIVAACLGAVVVLVVGAATGWIDGDDGVRTVVLPTVPTESGGGRADGRAVDRERLRPGRIYASRSEGVVTIYSYFGNGQRAQGVGVHRLRDGPHPHQLPRRHELGGRGRAVKGAERVYVVFHDGDRIPGTIVGWDLFNDTGLVKVDPKDHAVAPVPLGDSSRVVVGEPVAAIGSPFGQERLARGRRRLRDRAVDRLSHLRLRRLGRDPDRRSDQPRELGRAAAGRARPRDRDQRADPLRLGQRRGRRLRDPDQLRAPLDGAADRDRPGRLRVRRRHDAGRDTCARAPLRPGGASRRADPVRRRRCAGGAGGSAGLRRRARSSTASRSASAAT